MVEIFVSKVDQITGPEGDYPEVVFLFVSPDALAGHHSLANVDTFFLNCSIWEGIKKRPGKKV